MSWRARWRHLKLAIGCLPLLVHASGRRMLSEMRRFCRRLPYLLERPLPQAMRQLTASAAEMQTRLPEHSILRLADLAALLERRSPLGLCLRRSLVRYHYLHPLDLPLSVQFGAKLSGDKTDRDLTGHAWLVRDGQPYYEEDENWRGFTVMYTWPASGS
jgi:hypothetical protein